MVSRSICLSVCLSDNNPGSCVSFHLSLPCVHSHGSDRPLLRPQPGLTYFTSALLGSLRTCCGSWQPSYPHCTTLSPPNSFLSPHGLQLVSGCNVSPAISLVFLLPDPALSLLASRAIWEEDHHPQTPTHTGDTSSVLSLSLPALSVTHGPLLETWHLLFTSSSV